jgi:hypothetical protein
MIYNYYDSFVLYPINKLIKNQSQIELDLIDDLRNTICNLLVKNGYKKLDDIRYSKNKNIYTILIDFTKGQRSLIITLQNLFYDKKAISIEEKIENFGLIRSFIIQSDDCFPKILFDEIVHKLKNQIIEAYTALENAFLNNYKELDKCVFNNLYSCLKTRLFTNNISHLFGRCWFFISEEDIGYLYFDEEVRRKVINYYKNHQDNIYSPFELTVWIMSEPLPFKKTLAFESFRQKKPLSLSWEKARFISEAPKIFLAEVLLYKSQEYTAYIIANYRGYYLSITFPSNMLNQILPEIEILKHSLSQHFKNGIKKWSPYLKIVKSISTLPKTQRITDIVGTIIGKAAAEFIKSFNSP